jgi:hypothetical protein
MYGHLPDARETAGHHAAQPSVLGIRAEWAG